MFDSDTKKDPIKQASNQFQKVKDVIWTSNLSLWIFHLEVIKTLLIYVYSSCLYEISG